MYITGTCGSMLEDNLIKTCEETQGSRSLVQKYLQNPSSLCTVELGGKCASHVVKCVKHFYVHVNVVNDVVVVDTRHQEIVPDHNLTASFTGQL